MESKDVISIIGGASGLIGGTMGVLSWIKNSKKDNRTFDQVTYNYHLKYSYKLCYENDNCPETDGINVYFLWQFIERIREFQRHQNKFKGRKVTSNYEDTFVYADVIKFDRWFPWVYAFEDGEKNNDRSIEIYADKSVHIQRLKPFFREFYLSIFENIN